MTPNNNWTCWGITNCKESEECLARKHPDRPCWEIASEVGDHRSAGDICEDCIVHILKANTAALSESEIQSIIAHKTECVLATA